tara:strand:- start:8097 stop:8441 length:345 start_codon:yes stop_codon:yes gene_type:complete
MELEGKIKLIEKTESFGSNGFQKRVFVLVTDHDKDYPQHIKLEFHKDKCQLLDKFKVGQEVKVGININGREWTDPQGNVKHFNSIVAWFMKDLKDDNGSTASKQKEEVTDDLPF